MSLDRTFDEVLIEMVKLEGYCLNEDHPRGRHKARVFRSALGLTAADAHRLRTVLLDAARARADQLIATDKDVHGQRYTLDIPMTTESGSAVIRSTWIVRTGERVLRLTSCFVL